MTAARIVSAVIILALASIRGIAQSKFNITVTETKEVDWISQSGPPVIVLSAQVVLPDGAHARVSCVSGTSDECGDIESFTPEKAKPEDKTCTRLVEGDPKTTAAALVTTCVTKNLGNYEASRESNELIITVPSGTVRYHIDGSW